MSTKDDGGPAFPREDYQADNAPGQRGMSLRDYFAALAMQALLHPDHTKEATEDFHGNANRIMNHIAISAYRHADAMLAERSK